MIGIIYLIGFLGTWVFDKFTKLEGWRDKDTEPSWNNVMGRLIISIFWFIILPIFFGYNIVNKWTQPPKWL